jgi:hypothetical protein
MPAYGSMGSRSADDHSESPGMACCTRLWTSLLTVYIRIKFRMDLQADKSAIVAKGPFFPEDRSVRGPVDGRSWL